MSEKKDIYWRAYLVYFGVATLMLVVIIRTVMIQFDGGHPVFMSTSAGSVKMPTRTVDRTPRRGQIVDANYTPLVTSVSFYDIHMDPTVVPQAMIDSSLSDLAVALNELYPEKTAREYERIVLSGRTNGRRYVLIHKRATNEERKKLNEMPIFKEGRFKGGLLDNEETIERRRPHGELLKRTLGYVRVQADHSVKRVGLEGAYDEYLTGVPGKELEQKISTGWKKIGPVLREPIEGATIVTTIDKGIQEVAHAELLRQLQKQKAINGCAIVMDVKTGYVKAIVNLVRGNDGEYYEAYNHAIGTKEVPGSTFKLASLMALLEDGKVKLTDKVNAVGEYKFFNDKLTDSNPYGYGVITVQEAFEKSSNVFAKIVNDAYKHEPQAYVDRLKSFGIGSKLNLDIKGEPFPTLYEPGMKSWSGISLPWMAVGYEVQQTPLQTLAFYNAVANDGTFVRPQFVKEIRRGNEVEKTFPPIVVKDKICSERTIIDLKKCLKGVVQRGTGKALNSAYFDIAGKTGTARILGKDNNYDDNRYLASFAGYFPADNPIYSCIVVVTGPTEDIYGAVVSGTVFTAIANKVYASSLAYHQPVNVDAKRKKDIPRSKVGNRKDIEELFKRFRIPYTSLTDKEYLVVREDDGKAIMEQRFIGKSTVPNVIGMTAKDAVYLIESTGMNVRIEGFGRVISQSIKAGTQSAPGVVIQIILK
ncbi:MAG: transpeptidase family protein [Crocinitomicaceae bacterium]|nr:transpeptidase family protein [Flavobacteriales bacterium]NQZ37636.1 transpeptidase family protein [Crocinitomicaceae bacterium]